MKLSDTQIKQIGQSVVLNNVEVDAMTPEGRRLFTTGMSVAVMAHLEEKSLDEMLEEMIKPEVVARSRAEIMVGATAMKKEIRRVIEMTRPAEGSVVVYTVGACRRKPEAGKLPEDSVIVGSFPSMEAIQEFVDAGKLPPEFPYYAVTVNRVSFYVLVSPDWSSEEIHAMSRELRSADWLKLKIWSGPHLSMADAQEAMRKLEASGEAWRGAHFASMVDKNAAQLERVGRSTQ